MKILIDVKFYLILLALLVTQGCVGTQSMSSYARTGDTVTISLGGTEDNNALVEILKKEDIDVTITDSDSNTYPVYLRHLARVYPDHTSTYIFNTVNHTGSQDTFTPPLLGQWFAIIDLVDPDDRSVKHPLSFGPATISVSSPTQLDPNVYYLFAWTNGNLGSIDVEILPGEGTPHDLNYMSAATYHPITDLEPLPQIIVTPSAPPADTIAGGNFSFEYTETDFNGGLIAVQANHDPNVQLTSKHTTLGNGLKRLDVFLLNPKGFVNHNNRMEKSPSSIGIGKASPLRSVRFALVFKGDAIANNDLNWQDSITMVEGSSYIDLDGYDVMDVLPELKKVR